MGKKNRTLTFIRRDQRHGSLQKLNVLGSGGRRKIPQHSLLVMSNEEEGEGRREFALPMTRAFPSKLVPVFHFFKSVRDDMLKREARLKIS